MRRTVRSGRLLRFEIESTKHAVLTTHRWAEATPAPMLRPLAGPSASHLIGRSLKDPCLCRPFAGEFCPDCRGGGDAA